MAEMAIAYNDRVVGPSGAEVGRITHVISEGSSERVIEIVVSQHDGTEFTLPINAVQQREPGVFMIRAEPEKIRDAHPFDASGYREVEDGTDRVVVSSGSSPATSPMSGRTINPATPRTSEFTPASSHASGMSVPAPVHQSPSIAHVDHPVGASTQSVLNTASANRTGAIQPEVSPAAITATRTQISGTVGALQEKVSPDNLKDQVGNAVHEQVATTKGQIHDATIGQMTTTAGHARDAAQGSASNIIALVRANPLPAALMGLGISWLWKEHRQSSQAAATSYRYDSSSRGRTLPPDYRGGRSYQGDVRTHQTDDSVGEKISDAAGQVKETVGTVAGQTQERASHLMNQAGETVGTVAGAAQERVSDLTHSVGDTAGGFGSSAVSMIRANPIPAALTGIGIGWLLLNRSKGQENGSTASHRTASTYSPGKQYMASGHGASEGTAIDTLGNAASTTKAKAGDLIGQAGESVGNLAGSAQDRARDLSDTVQYGALEAQSRFARVFHENPMNLGMVALSLGLAAGFTFPATPAEDQLFGEERDALLGKTAKTIQKAQKVAQDLQKVVEDMQAPTASR